MAFIRIPAGAQEIVNVAGATGETVARIYRIGRQHYIKKAGWKESKKITESDYESYEKIGTLNKKGNRSRRF
jgi:hypothetical protein